LGNDEDLAVDVGKGEVHLPGLILEHPKVEDLLGKAFRLIIGIFGADADEEKDPPADLRYRTSARANRRPGHPLEKYPHAC
jgi:hypothetical protein